MRNSGDDVINTTEAASKNSVSIILPGEVFSNQSVGEDISVVFSLFQSSDLYPLTNQTFDNFSVASNLISATVIGSENISGNITMVMKLDSGVSKKRKEK